MKALVFSLFLIFTNSLFGYVTTRTEYNQDLKWDSRATSLDIYVDVTKKGYNSSSLSESEIKSIIEDSINDWNQHTPLPLEIIYSTNLPSMGTSKTIRFTNNESEFGTGVLAVTSISHSASNGKIYSADILINGSGNNPNVFTDDPNLSGGYYAYLGDVLTHELGHLWGLGHSDVFGSSMVFSVFKGQHSTHTDDHSGITYLYGNKDYNGEVSGTIISGNSIPVFGVQVQAISFKTGKAVSGVLTDSNGRFKLTNLPEDDSYLIYVLPPRSLDHLPEYYSSVQTKYCSGKSFVPSFYTECGGGNKGHPQAIAFTDSLAVEIGEVTIRCDEGVAPDYLYSKQDSQAGYQIQNVTKFDLNSLSTAFVGHFSLNEIKTGISGNPDMLDINLENFSVPSIGNYYLNIKVISEDIGSSIGTLVEVKNDTGSTLASSDMSYGSFWQRNTLHDLNIPLSQTSSDNIFQLKVYPREMTTTEIVELFSNGTIMINSNHTYLVLTSIVKITGSSVEYYSTQGKEDYDDNKYCSEGEATYTARPNAMASSGLSVAKEADSPNALSCASIDTDNTNGPMGGLMSFAFGAGLIFLFMQRQRKSNEFFV